MYKSFIVIGANGLLGKSIVKYLELNKHKVIKINKKNYLKKKNSYADIVINANGNSNKFFANNNPNIDFKKSFLTTFKSIEDFKFKKYIFLSSGDIYATPELSKTHEKNCFDFPANFYGKNKILSEKLIQFYCKKWLIFRLGPVIGKNIKKNAVYNIMNNLHVYDNIKSKSSFIDSDSVAKIIYKINKKINNQIFNLSGKGTVSLERIKKMTKSNSTFDNKRLKKKYELNINKLSNLIKIPKTEFELKKLIS